MPNHVYSSVTIYGESKTLDTIKETLKGEENGELRAFDFNKVIPMPDSIFKGNVGEAERKIHGSDNWYDWSISNWGSKWNAYNQPDYLPDTIQESNSISFIKGTAPKGLVSYYFCTAWSPVSQVISKLSENYPETIIRYTFEDEGGGFAGVEYYSNGIIIKENQDLNQRQIKSLNSKTSEQLLRELRTLENKTRD